MLPVLSTIVCFCLLPPPPSGVFDAVCESEKELESWLKSKDFDVNLSSPSLTFNNLNAREGTTLLVFATHRSEVKAIALLLKYGARVDAKDSFGDLPLHVAVQGSNIDLPTVEVLLRACADPYATNAKNETSFQLIDENNTRVIELIRTYDVHYLAEQGQAERIRELILACPNRLTMRNADGDTPLHTAAGAGRREIVDWLVEHGADLKATNRFGESVVCSAAIWNEREIANHLLSKGVPLDPYSAIALGKRERVENELQKNPAFAKAVDARGLTPLHWAVRHNDAAIVKLLISRAADVNAVDSGGDTPLFLAARFGYADVAEVLLEAGAKPNWLNKTGIAALHLAAGHGHLELVKKLCATGATIDLRDEQVNLTPLHAAIVGNHLEVSEFLISKGASHELVVQGMTPLILAAKYGRMELVEFLISKGADVNRRSESADSALCAAIKAGSLESVGFLIKHGADVLQTCENNFPMVALARIMRREDIVDVLAEAGADSSFSQLHYAALSGDLASLKSLLDQDATKIDQVDQKGSNALQYAISAQKIEIVRELLSRGANPTLAGSNGETPLDKAGKINTAAGAEMHKIIVQYSDLNPADTSILWAAKNGKPDALVAALEKHPARVNCKRKGDGDSPLHVAAINGNADCASILISKGADVRAKNAQNKTPLEMVRKRTGDDFPRIIRMLQEAEKQP